MQRPAFFVSASLAAMLCALAAPALAQDGSAGTLPQDAADDPDSAGDIIVTATRRASPLAEVPIAVSAVTAQSLQNSGANDIRQLNQLAPSLLVSSTGSEANGAARIRGVGTVGDNPGLESSVAVFIDGVYRSRTGAGLTDLGEIERIEVLRGPQGTLFGRNASAGLLNIVSKSPSFTFGASGELSYGNYEFWRAAGRVTGPISETIAASLDGVYSRRDGFLKIVDATGNETGDTNDRNRYFLRGQLLFEPTSDLSIRLIGDYTNRDESCCGAVFIDTGEEVGTSPTNYTQNATNRIVTILGALGTRFPNGATPYAQDPYERKISITPGRDYVSDLKDWGVSAEINYDLGSAKLTSITAYRDYKSADYGDYDYSTADLLYRDPGTFRQFRTFTQELRLQGSAFGEALDWLVGGYYANEKLTLRDNIRFGADYGRFAACRLMAGAGNTSNLAPTQLALCGAPIDGNPATPDVGNLIAGTQANLNAGLTQAFVNAGLPLANAQAQAAAISGGLGQGLTALATIPTGAGDTDTRYYQKSENWALFTHNIVHLTDRLDLTLGLRYTNERKRFSADLNNNNATCAALQASALPGVATNAQLGSAAQLAGGILTLACLGNASTSLNGLDLQDSFNDDEFTGTAVLSYKVGGGVMVYGGYSRGYKAGGYNLDRFELGNRGVAPAISPITYFSPRTNADASSLLFGAETVDAFEIGLKINKRSWGFNAALFRQEFSNFQLNTFNGTSFVVQNINGCKSAKAANGTCEDTKPGLISEGVELEAYVAPTRYLRGTAGVTYAKAQFADQLVGNASGSTPLDPALFLLEGQDNSNAPRWVTTASLAWTPPIGGGYSGLLYVDTRMTGDHNTGSDLYPEKRQDGYIVTNARIGIRGPDERWAIEFWGQNIFDSDYTQVAFNSPLQSSSPNNQSTGQLGRFGTMSNQLFSAYLAEPRTYGITLRGKF
ncbi:TonB-dependent receptor [Sphingobium lignivorans]|uniref:Outer membrane receptor protein involved in Fe transport n=1 Tax=Sphingobium lignivorans TaxID=2735886 RepID=A0ABR6NKL0_9SPHN|nr:TonB-dependent receptor [Sphingobium lignivorans]MBB5987814.1 outer membrane receptor protein involved in Fe transport [Sphingobium lignivorans]